LDVISDGGEEEEEDDDGGKGKDKDKDKGKDDGKKGDLVNEAENFIK